MGNDFVRVPLDLLESIVASGERPAMWIDRSGAIRLTNEAAKRLLALPSSGTVESAKEILGLGWRELETVARDGSSDLVVNLRVAGTDGTPVRRGVRARLQAVPDARGPLTAILAVLEMPAGRSRYSSRRHQGLADDEPDPFRSIEGSDPVLLDAKRQAQSFAATSLPILLVAETGTGKDRFARAIHLASQRRSGPFVAINCGGLSPHLLESELFGYGPGSFTGARREGQDGKVGAADGGTLFLDEVAEMPSALQALLLRFLEDGTFYRVGENKLRRSDVRLVCATCRDLPALAGEGAFRRDLYYRIKGTCITLPPLRERGDLAEFALLLLDDLAAAQHIDRPPRLSTEALEWIARQDWPGNVRELRNALHHAVVLANDEILLDHLPIEPHIGLTPVEPMPAEAPRSARVAPPGSSLSEAKLSATRKALKDAGGNLSAAARTLGIARSTLYRLMKRHGIEPARGD